MTTLYASLRLRPTRIGFLVRPTDRAAVRQIMRLCVCLWGGIYNPIIPVTRTLPKAWRQKPYHQVSGNQLTEGYLRFFEPDVFVEATAGLAAKIGIKEEGNFSHNRRVVSLSDFVTTDEPRLPEFAFGLNVFDLYRHLYERQFQFVPRHERRIAFFGPSSRDNAFIEAAFGMFPRESDLQYIAEGYLDAFDPVRLQTTHDSWRRVFADRLSTPLSMGRRHIEREPTGWRDPVIFILDPESTHDLIDFWNIRLLKPGVVPVHIDWISQIKDCLRDLIQTNFRPLPGNPHGVMIDTTIEFGRSIPEERAREVASEHFSDLPHGSFGLKLWYDPIWRDDHNDFGPERRRVQLTSDSADLELSVADDDRSIRFQTLSPEFAERFGGSARWANVLTLRDYGSKENLALAFSSNIKDAAFPRMGLGKSTIVSREGFVFVQHYPKHHEVLRLMKGPDAIIAWLQEQEIKARLSESGRIAEQVLSSVGGPFGARLLADAETLQLLDKMAKSVRVRRGELGGHIQEEYPDRTASVVEWKSLVHRRANLQPLPELTLDHLVEAGIIRLGLVALCPSCNKENWYSLREVDYQVPCERCLREFRFPQGGPDFREAAWRYRVVGPFSVPDFAGGAYATALTLRVFAENLGVGDKTLTYTPGLDLAIDGNSFEIDFAFWFRRDHPLGQSEEPTLVFGEAKSFARTAFQPVDIRRLRALGARFPGAFLVLSTLKESLSHQDKKSAQSLSLWGRIPLESGLPRSPVIVLTGTELFADWSVEEEWKKRGGRRAAMAESGYLHLDNLWTLADLTQEAYLDLPPYHKWLDERFASRRRARFGLSAPFESAKT